MIKSLDYYKNIIVECSNNIRIVEQVMQELLHSKAIKRLHEITIKYPSTRKRRLS